MSPQGSTGYPLRGRTTIDRIDGLAEKRVEIRKNEEKHLNMNRKLLDRTTVICTEKKKKK